MGLKGACPENGLRPASRISGFRSCADTGGTVQGLELAEDDAVVQELSEGTAARRAELGRVGHDGETDAEVGAAVLRVLLPVLFREVSGGTMVVMLG